MKSSSHGTSIARIRSARKNTAPLSTQTSSRSPAGVVARDLLAELAHAALQRVGARRAPHPNPAVCATAFATAGSDATHSRRARWAALSTLARALVIAQDAAVDDRARSLRHGAGASPRLAREREELRDPLARRGTKRAARLTPRGGSRRAAQAPAAAPRGARSRSRTQPRELRVDERLEHLRLLAQQRRGAQHVRPRCGGVHGAERRQHAVAHAPARVSARSRCLRPRASASPRARQ